MSTARDRRLVCTLVALAWLGVAPGSASAQAAIVWSTPVAAPMCIALATPSCTDPTSCPGGQACTEFEFGGSRCTTPGSLFCVSAGVESPCPTERPVRRTLAGVELCVSERFIECASMGTRGACFTAAGGMFPSDWDRGDCDMDGLVNGVDPVPCEAPPFIATLTSEGACVPARDLCAEDDDCEAGAVCGSVHPDNPHHYCLPSEPAAFCCGGLLGTACPDTSSCEPDEPDGFQHCHEYCVEMSFTERVKCVQFLGDFPVEPDDGDCDGDGLRNGDELDLGSDPCAADDAGVVMPEPDGGNVETDGGAGELDSGTTSTMDGGTEPQPGVTFGGGGGCRCGVATSERAAMPWGLVLVGLVAWRTARRRRR